MCSKEFLVRFISSSLIDVILFTWIQSFGDRFLLLLLCFQLKNGINQNECDKREKTYWGHTNLRNNIQKRRERQLLSPFSDWKWPFFNNGIAPLCWRGTVNDDRELDAHRSRFDNRNKRSPSKQDEWLFAAMRASTADEQVKRGNVNKLSA